MKLIIEDTMLLDGSIEENLNESTGTTERNYYISGTFSTPDAKNRNGRVYSRAIWEREVNKYQKEIKEKTTNTLGEWQHPPRSTVDPLKAVMRIVELKLDENGNVVGKAKILNDNTEQTNKLKGLIKEGIKIGVSSRGVGKVSATGIVEDFKLITYDAVDMPSDYNAMLNGMVEGYTFENGVMLDKEYQIDENGCVGEICNLTPTVESDNTNNIKEPCPIQTKIEEAVEQAKEEIYNNIGEYFEKVIGPKLDSISEKVSEKKQKDIIEKWSGSKEYIFKTRNDADIASDKLIKYSEEGWEIQGKIIIVETEDVEAELKDIIKDSKLTISNVVTENKENKEKKKIEESIKNLISSLKEHNKTKGEK